VNVSISLPDDPDRVEMPEELALPFSEVLKGKDGEGSENSDDT